MPDIIKELYDKICTIDTLEEYQNVIPDSIEKMEAAGYKNMADKVRVLSELREHQAKISYIARYAPDFCLALSKKNPAQLSQVIDIQFLII